MKKILLFICVSVIGSFSHSLNLTHEENLQAAREYSAPKEFWRLYSNLIKTRKEITINEKAFNPFFLSGDFDGDGLTDYVIRVEGDGDHDTVILLGNKKIEELDVSSVVGGSPPMTWTVRYSGEESFTSDSISEPLKFDSVAIYFGESTQALIYYNGKEFIVFSGMGC